ncbi:protein of unknown function (plasmid) [Methylocella tundrae]|uniref:Uncharacterized protein n=1 Tax=Methylocella tundrae TaxID=227605 RepID=A0A4U8Z6W1_METTU|nr:protein of unknown function [Methylocella tundrae]
MSPFGQISKVCPLARKKQAAAKPPDRPHKSGGATRGAAAPGILERRGLDQTIGIACGAGQLGISSHDPPAFLQHAFEVRPASCNIAHAALSDGTACFSGNSRDAPLLARLHRAAGDFP